MWVDGIDIVREDTVKCFRVDDNYVFLTDENGNIIFSFDTKKNEENVKNELKELAQKTIMRYDIIKKIQEDYS